MPYNNQYNQSVATAVRRYSQKHIDRENAINDFSTTYEIPSMLEASVLKDPAVHGGEPTVRAKVTVKAEGADRAVGGGGLRSRRIAIVKEVMQKHGLSLIAASKYVKEHKLY